MITLNSFSISNDIDDSNVYWIRILPKHVFRYIKKSRMIRVKNVT